MRKSSDSCRLVPLLLSHQLHRLWCRMSTPPAKRHACERCWKRKARCDRQAPSCQMCREAGVECRSRLINAGNDDENDAVVVGESYVQTLKRKIVHLEARCRDKRRCTTAEPLSQSGELQTTPDEAESEPTAGSSVASVHNALADLGHFGLNTTPRDPGPVDWRPKPFSLWSLAHAAVQWSSTGAVEQEIVANGSLTRERHSTLSSEVTLPLMREYIESVLCLYPFIQARDLFVHHDRFLAASSESPNHHGELLTCLALATACTKHRRKADVDLVAMEARSAIFRLCASMPEREPVASMQCLVAAVLYALYGTTIESAAYLVRLALSKAIALGFHRMQTHDADDKWRIISVLYVIER